MSEHDPKFASDALSLRLIHRAARNAPDSLSERLEEEWRADLSTRTTARSRLSFALGCCWATRVIAFQHGATRVRATTTATAPDLALAYAPSSFKFFTNRSPTFLLVLCLHAAIFYAILVSVQGSIKIHVNPTPLQNQVLQQPQRHDPLPSLPPTHLTTWTLERLDPKLPPIDFDSQVDIIAQPPTPQPPTSTETHKVTRLQGGPGVGFPDADIFYPTISRWKAEQGVATIGVCVDSTGRLTAEPTTLQTSGSARLDGGALALAKAASGHYRPSTEDGRPINACYPFRVRFQLHN